MAPSSPMSVSMAPQGHQSHSNAAGDSAQQFHLSSHAHQSAAAAAAAFAMSQHLQQQHEQQQRHDRLMAASSGSSASMHAAAAAAAAAAGQQQQQQFNSLMAAAVAGYAGQGGHLSQQAHAHSLAHFPYSAQQFAQANLSAAAAAAASQQLSALASRVQDRSFSGAEAQPRQHLMQRLASNSRSPSPSLSHVSSASGRARLRSNSRSLSPGSPCSAGNRAPSPQSQTSEFGEQSSPIGGQTDKARKQRQKQEARIGLDTLAKPHAEKSTAVEDDKATSADQLELGASSDKLSPARPGSSPSGSASPADNPQQRYQQQSDQLLPRHSADALAPTHIAGAAFPSLEHFSAAMAAAAASQFAASNRQQQHQFGAYHAPAPSMSPAALFALRSHLSQQHPHHLLSAFHSLAASSSGSQLGGPLYTGAGFPRLPAGFGSHSSELLAGAGIGQDQLKSVANQK